MGFFSSRKEDPVDEHRADKVVLTIRSRFYGRNKARERIDASPAAPSRSTPPPSSPATSPLPPAAQALPASPRTHAAQLPSAYLGDPAAARSDTSSLSSHAYGSGAARPISNTMARANTDAVTVTLAQRLSELATANEEGLLNDDEYRVLRQSLFERFAGGSPVPTEAPIVRMSVVEPSGNGRASTSSQRPHSKYHSPSTRAPSVHSRHSVTSTVTGLFRRAAGRKSSVSDMGDTMSTYSQGSATPSVFTRTAGRKFSDASLYSPDSPSSSSSRMFAGGKRTRSSSTDDSAPSPVSPAARRQSGAGGPPSAYRGGDARAAPGAMDDLAEDAALDSAAAVRREIALVEAEARRLQDTFNGLELATLTRRHPGGSSPRRPAPARRAESAPAERHDAASVRSDHSRGTSRSAPLSARARAPPVSQPVTLSRKTSLSSLGSRARARSPHGGSPAASAVSLGSPPPAPPPALASVAEDALLPRASGGAGGDDDDEEYAALAGEMADIRRKRAEVTARYDARLEFLRAKLKSAEMKERLLRK